MMRITKYNWKHLAFTAASLLIGAGQLIASTATVEQYCTAHSIFNR